MHTYDLSTFHPTFHCACAALPLFHRVVRTILQHAAHAILQQNVAPHYSARHIACYSATAPQPAGELQNQTPALTHPALRVSTGAPHAALSQGVSPWPGRVHASQRAASQRTVTSRPHCHARTAESPPAPPPHARSSSCSHGRPAQSPIPRKFQTESNGTAVTATHCGAGVFECG